MKVLSKYIFLLAVAVLFSALSFAGGNNKTVQLKGKVVDNQGNPIIGAKIEISESNQIFYTDFDGEFTMKTVKASKKEIRVSYVSFETQELELNSEDLSNSDLIFQLYSK